jgi:hypothetical protein
VAGVSNDIVPVVTDQLEPLTEAAAKVLDKKIRATANRAANNLHDLLNLMSQAAAGQAYVGLGFATPAAYFYDAVRLDVSDIAQQKLLGALIADRRLTSKAIAAAFNSSPSATA